MESEPRRQKAIEHAVDSFELRPAAVPMLSVSLRASPQSDGNGNESAHSEPQGSRMRTVENHPSFRSCTLDGFVDVKQPCYSLPVHARHTVATSNLENRYRLSAARHRRATEFNLMASVCLQKYRTRSIPGVFATRVAVDRDAWPVGRLSVSFEQVL
ncbi:hypothetical protein PUNSTDRAFT_111054 [Punctularia strigosozonata HHB-11173 SS5]|uniref:uncharacterized protein n=1 Tax=Punctularia strigosozonata (strain HHB-11173) TaxID=741275 RepID=UPI0004416DD5|nr:uncharacterized protein PUNSTDRAFT_111054 [Punctularia strigosozonata HHB-11173 SS5]EIN12626.1 hypothetical protein PUNSTDRAFT_111054 [Punctularia strigosozonata HHB-11173 SS5]